MHQDLYPYREGTARIIIGDAAEILDQFIKESKSMDGGFMQLIKNDTKTKKVSFFYCLAKSKISS